MKYYGIEIKRFCGVDVSTNTPSILPEFIVRMAESVKSMFAVVEASDVESFVCVMNRTNDNVFRVVYETVDTETFTANITGNKDYSPLVEMDDYELN